MSGGNASLPILGTVIFLMLMLYVMIGSYMEHKHSPFGHETGVALVAGLIISAIIHYTVSDLSLTFNGEIFFYVCLPPIIFAAGFNMRRRRFFENIGYILTFWYLRHNYNLLRLCGSYESHFKSSLNKEQ